MVVTMNRNEKSKGRREVVRLIGHIVKTGNTQCAQQHIPKRKDVACQTKRDDELEKQLANNQKIAAELMALRKKYEKLEKKLMATQSECEFWMERALPEYRRT